MSERIEARKSVQGWLALRRGGGLMLIVEMVEPNSFESGLDRCRGWILTMRVA